MAALASDSDDDGRDGDGGDLPDKRHSSRMRIRASYAVAHPGKLRHHLIKRYGLQDPLIMDFVRGFESVMNDVHNPFLFLKLLRPYKSSSARIGEDESICRLLLSVPALQPAIAQSLLEHLFRAAERIPDADHYDQLRFGDNVPRLILRQFSLLHSIQEPDHLKRKIGELMAGNLPDYIQRDLIRMIPEILVDHVDEVSLNFVLSFFFHESWPQND